MVSIRLSILWLKLDYLLSHWKNISKNLNNALYLKSENWFWNYGQSPFNTLFKEIKSRRRNRNLLPLGKHTRKLSMRSKCVWSLVWSATRLVRSKLIYSIRNIEVSNHWPWKNIVKRTKFTSNPRILSFSWKYLSVNDFFFGL